MIRPFGLSEAEVKRILRYCVVGVSNTIVDFLVFVVVYYVFSVDTYISQAVAFLTSTFNSYIWNRRFTFKSREKLFGKNLLLFYVLNLITMSISLLGLWFFYDVLGINEIISKILTGPFVFTVNYLGNRFFIFKGEEKPPSLGSILGRLKNRNDEM